MLQRALQPALRRVPTRREACILFSCRCGATFQYRPFSATSQRYSKRAPSTARSDNRRLPLALQPKDARAYQKIVKERGIYENNHWRAKRDLLIEYNAVPFKTAKEFDHFVDAVKDMISRTTFRVGGRVPEAFLQLIQKCELNEKHLMNIVMLFLRSPAESTPGVEDRYWGRKLMDMTSAAGYAEATIRIVHNYLIQSYQKPGVLRNAAVAIERGRLEKIASEGVNTRAMVLVGKVAYAVGDRDTAIKWWWRAVDEAVNKGNDWLKHRNHIEIERTELFNYGRDLTSPWIELIEAHFDRSRDPRRTESLRNADLERCEKAIEIGVGQDDPTAFYYAATFHKKHHEDGTHMPTSDWLYNMTKAAASAMPKAMYELANYYAYSGWKYIEDEPPDHLKPTPFDTAPPDTLLPTFWTNLRRFLSPGFIAPKISDKEQVFHSAAWPATPLERYLLAQHWADMAKTYLYVPAFLLKAKLYMEPTLWAGARAPAEALALDPERYLYASKREEADAHFTGDVKTWKMPEDAVDPPNPTYNEFAARNNLLEVLYAAKAIELRDNAIKTYARMKRVSNVSWDDVDLEPEFSAENEPAKKFLRNRDVMEMWQGEIHALAREVKDICDEKGWDLRNDQGALWYKCSSSSSSSSVGDATRQSAIGNIW